MQLFVFAAARIGYTHQGAKSATATSHALIITRHPYMYSGQCHPGSSPIIIYNTYTQVRWQRRCSNSLVAPCHWSQRLPIQEPRKHAWLGRPQPVIDITGKLSRRRLHYRGYLPPWWLCFHNTPARYWQPLQRLPLAHSVCCGRLCHCRWY